MTAFRGVASKPMFSGIFTQNKRYFSGVEDHFEEPEADCADAFPLHVIVPEDLLLDLIQKKRMKKLEINDVKKQVSLEGVFPEVINEQIFEEETLN